MTSDSPDVPFEILLRITQHVDRQDTTTLARLLRVSKAFFLAAAPRLYEEVQVTDVADLLVDTGLDVRILDRQAADAAHAVTTADESLPTDISAQNRAGVVKEPPRGLDAGEMGASDATGDSNLTTKAYCLAIVRVLSLGCGRQLHESVRSPILDLSIPMTTAEAISNLQTLRIHAKAVLSGGAAISRSRIHDLARQLAPKRITIDCTFTELLDLGVIQRHPWEDPIHKWDEAMMGKEVIVLVRKESDRLPSTSYSHAQIPPISASPTSPALPVPCSFGVTIILVATPDGAGRFTLGDENPFNNMVMTMEWHPDYAPGWLNGWTAVIGSSLAHERQSLTLVNWGRLGGEDFGMPQAAESTIEDRLRRGIAVRYRRALSQRRWRVEQEGGEHRNEADWEREVEERLKEVEVVGMKEWLRGRKDGGRGVLDDKTLEDWKRFL